MEPTYEDALNILNRAKERNLLTALLLQLRKDYHRINLTFPLAEAEVSQLTSAGIFQRLRENLYYLLMEHFDAYLNLMYTVDVPEREFKHIEPTDAVEVAGQVCYLVLRREWEKIELRTRYDQK